MGLRFARKLGILRTLVVVVLLLGFFSQIFAVDPGRGGHLALSVGMALLLFSAHTLRTDRSFLRSLVVNARLLMGVEYLIIASPFLLFLMYRQQWPSLFFLVGWATILPVLSPSVSLRRTVSNGIGNLMPLRAYEWRSGLRRTWPVLISIVLLTPPLVSLHMMAGWAGLFLLTAVSASHYRDCEPFDYILQQAGTAPGFLLGKLASGTGIHASLSAPSLVTLLVVYPSEWTFTLLFWSANTLLLGAVILGKYAFYMERKNLELVLSILFGLFCLMLLIPYMPLVALLTLIWLAYRARNRMQIVVYA